MIIAMLILLLPCIHTFADNITDDKISPAVLAAKASTLLDAREVDMALGMAYKALSLLSKSQKMEAHTTWGQGSSARSEALLVVGRALATTGRYAEAAERLSEAVSHVKLHNCTCAIVCVHTVSYVTG